ncbi:LSM domain-containing protein [Aspergillus clavatus NRRL 1]|uniref:LSM domain protein n=1 Tax=Aspergillus clavatus (strain ATCC 1007 / CBS 513.65 / DSM 816 / NCTC 3887 / NRRL 1 / QM 1276 / 107) TaxID=344612 RepID=A1CER3_ASPCL|nr:LSM domain protein [Aspergillus clavatus NRRL 1]EAW11362.1 LSM domain protein [Aspergillus clavatus NRRL 1]
MDELQAVRYLESLIGQTLRVHATDTRMFVGTFKCTDAERNIILGNTYEYRFPSSSAIKDAAAKTNDGEEVVAPPERRNIKLDMTSRFIGLVVVPSQHITKIELEETPQQSHLRDTLRKT